MSKTFIPIYVELTSCSPYQAKAAKTAISRLLSEAMVKTMLQAQGVSFRAITVSDPVDEKGKPV